MGILGFKMLLRTTKMGFVLDNTDAPGKNHSGNIHYLLS